MKRPTPLLTRFRQAERDQVALKLAMKELRRMSLTRRLDIIRFGRALGLRAEKKAADIERKRVAALPKTCAADAIEGKCGEPATHRCGEVGYCEPHSKWAEQHGDTVVENK